jgi:hypothetical protein
MSYNIKKSIFILFFGLAIGYGSRYYLGQLIIDTHYSNWAWNLIGGTNLNDELTIKTAKVLREMHEFPLSHQILDIHKNIGRFNMPECVRNKQYRLYVDNKLTLPKFFEESRSLALPKNIKEKELKEILRQFDNIGTLEKPNLDKYK